MPQSQQETPATVCCWCRTFFAVFCVACAQFGDAFAAPFDPYLVKDVYPGPDIGVRSGLIALDGELYFPGLDGVGTGVLWKSDGTEAGTVRVREDGPTGVLKHQTVSGGKLFFLAEGASGDGIGEELWVSDGTSAGTHLVKDIYPVFSALPNNLTDVNGTLFFKAMDGVHGDELWKTDGTEAGTIMVKDINPGTDEIAHGDNSSPSSLVNLNGTVIFNANDGSGIGNELWKTDGTEAGTVLVKDINPGSGGSGGAGGLVIHGETLLFSAFTSTQGNELWRTDGTEAGTMLVKEFRPGTSSGLQFDNYLTKLNDSTVYFRADDGTNGEELWKSDGTEAGTVMIKNINPSSPGGAPARLTNLNGTIYFQANDGTHGTELWKSDGTEAGTQMVVDLVSGSGSPGFNSSEMLAVNDLLFFTAAIPNGGLNDHTLFMTDGTEEGTEPVFTVPGIDSSTLRVTDLEFTGSHLFFRAPLDVSQTGTPSNFELFAIAFPTVVPLPGDFNGDGIVDAADYTVWRDHMGTSFALGGNGEETGEGAGVVDMADYAMWKEHYGQSLQVLNEGSSTTVPEPTSGLLWAGVGIVLASTRRSRQP